MKSQQTMRLLQFISQQFKTGNLHCTILPTYMMCNGTNSIKKSRKKLLSKRKLKITDRVAVSFTYDDLVTLDEDRAAAIQWTASSDFYGSRQPSRGRVLTEHSSDWKKTAESRKNKSRNLACWNCDSLNHRARQCPKPLRSDVRERLEERHQFKGGDDYVRSPASFEKRNFHSGARAEEFEPGKRTKGRKDNDDHYSPNAASRPV